MSKTQKIIVVVITVVLFVGVAFCGVSWNLTQQDLDFVRAELSDTQAVLESNRSELSEVKDELLATEADLQETETELWETEVELLETSNYLSTVEAKLLETETRLSAIQANMFHLHNPTFEEVTSFLREDKTDSNEYLEDEYVCSHFAGDVNKNAESQGIRCAYVAIRFPELGHAIIAFDTTDEGVIYFDPITDERVRPVIGKEYWRCIEPRPGYYYEKPLSDDTIVDILVIW